MSNQFLSLTNSSFVESLYGTVSPADYAVFGGTFDPVHEGHIDALRSLLGVFSLVVLAPTRANPWKEKPCASFELRLEMLRRVLEAEKMPFSETPIPSGVHLAAFQYDYVRDFVVFYRELINTTYPERGGTLYWAVGEDIVQNMAQWRDWDQLNIKPVVLRINIPVHALNVRNGSAKPHSALLSLLKQEKLYS